MMSILGRLTRSVQQWSSPFCKGLGVRSMRGAIKPNTAPASEERADEHLLVEVEWDSTLNSNHIFKFGIAGDSCVDYGTPEPTVAVGRKVEIINVGSCHIKSEIFDFAGQKAYRIMHDLFYPMVDGVLLVYDITRKETFIDIASEWLDKIKEFANIKVIILVGAKMDLETYREVSFEEGLKFAEENSLFFMECSALTCGNVDNIFRMLAVKVYEQWETERENAPNLNETITLSNVTVPAQPKKKCC